jgi:hypothetical protein
MKHILSLIILFLLSPHAFSETTDNRTLELKNEFIKLIVNNTETDKARFAIETTEGDPNLTNDDSQPLIYGRPIPWTSYTTVLIDNDPVIFGGASKKIQRRIGSAIPFSGIDFQKKTDTSIISLATHRKIEISQELSFLRNTYTRVNDTVLIEYTLSNRDVITHNIGLRIMLDTKLGSNDGAPFRLGTQGITSETRIYKEDLSDFWLTFDSLSSPNVIAQGTLFSKDGKISPPSSILLANWGTLVDKPWDIDYKKGRSFIRMGELDKDTALAMYWNPVTLLPNESITIRTAYGLGGLTLSPGELSLGLTAPTDFRIGKGGDFLIMAYILNSGGFDIRNTTVSFTLPPGFTVSSGKKNTIVDYLASGETKQIPIRVTLSPSAKAGNQKIILRVSSDTLENNEIEREIFIIAPPAIESTFILPSIKQLDKNTYIKATLIVHNPSTYTLRNIENELEIDTNLNIPSFEENKKMISTLKPNETSTLNWYLKIAENLGEKAQVSATITSKAIEKQGHVQSVFFQKVPFSLTQEISRHECKEKESFFIRFDASNTYPKTIESLSIQFDSSQIQYLSHSIEPALKDSFARANIVINNNAIEISNIQINKSVPQLPLLKIHFIGKSKGESTLIIKENNEIKDVINVTIKQGDPT